MRFTRNYLVWTLTMAAVLTVGAVVRFYRLAAQPLWLDELYTAEIVRGGLDTIWRTAFVDTSAPLSILPFWLSVQVSGLNEWGLRAASATASLLALIVFCYYCHLTLSRPATFVATALFAILPLNVYYAQEARAYAFGLLWITLSLVVYERLKRNDSIANWTAYAVCAAGAAQEYFPLILIGAQLLVLLALARNRLRILVGGACTVMAVLATLGPFAIGATTTLGRWNSIGGLDFLSTMQTIVAGDTRFAIAATRMTALLAVSAGAALALFDRHTAHTTSVHIAQCSALCLVSFIVLPVIGKPSPPYEERAFLILLPSVIVLLVLGLSFISRHRVGLALSFALLALLGAVAAQNLSAYFTAFDKSPEGIIAAQIMSRMQNTDTALTHSDSYSVDAALRFYAPSVPVYRYGGVTDGRTVAIRYPTNVSALRRLQEVVDFTEVASSSRLWFVRRAPSPPYLGTLLEHYEIREDFTIPPFHAILLVRR